MHDIFVFPLHFFITNKLDIKIKKQASKEKKIISSWSTSTFSLLRL